MDLLITSRTTNGNNGRGLSESFQPPTSVIIKKTVPREGHNGTIISCNGTAMNGGGCDTRYEEDSERGVGGSSRRTSRRSLGVVELPMQDLSNGGVRPVIKDDKDNLSEPALVGV